MDHRELLGKEAQSKVTGFTGIITARADYLTGCVQYCVKPPVDADGKDQKSVWVDVDELEILDDGVSADFDQEVRDTVVVRDSFGDGFDAGSSYAKRTAGGPQADTPPDA